MKNFAYGVRQNDYPPTETVGKPGDMQKISYLLLDQVSEDTDKIQAGQKCI